MEGLALSLEELYGESAGSHRTAFIQLKNLFEQKFGQTPAHFFSSPGRSELCGNHTDHNGGKVLATSINLDKIAAISPREDGIIRLYTEGFPEVVDITISGDEGTVYRKGEEGSSASLVRGIAASFLKRSFRIGGFNGCIKSRVAMGSGLSSSASLEILIGKIFSTLFNDDSLTAEVLAIIGQEAENSYFGKPCGLMDQLACAVGGIIMVDFKRPGEPLVKRIDTDFTSYGYSLLIVHTGGSHADLTDDYAAIPEEMKRVARYFGHDRCRDFEEKELFTSLQELRKQAGDRAVLRAMHFFQENRRVEEAVEAISNEDLDRYLKLIEYSGESSRNQLQNVFSMKDPGDQGMNLALSLADIWIKEYGRGVARVHGGGFAGTIQAYVPSEEIDNFSSWMEGFLGKGSVTTLTVRKAGPVELSLDPMDAVIV